MFKVKHFHSSDGAKAWAVQRQKKKREMFQVFSLQCRTITETLSKKILAFQQDGQHQQDTWLAAISNAFPYGHMLLSLSFLWLQNAVLSVGKVKQFYGAQIRTENPSLGSDTFWVLGATMDKTYFLQILQLSNEKGLLSYLRKKLRTLTG